MNSVILRGNVGTDIVLRATASGKPVLNLRIAVNSVRRIGCQTLTETNWFNIVVWGPEAEQNAEYLCKGSDIIVEGSLNTRRWTDRDGTRHETTEIIARKISWLTLTTPQKNKAEEITNVST